MHAGASHAENLFERLVTYTPRVGDSSVRTPLENFCTEALAWCLLEFPSFRREFLRLIDEALKTPIWNGIDPLLVDVATQNHYQVDEIGHKDRGQFDLLLTSCGTQRLAVVIEVKVDDQLDPKQPSRYRERLARCSYTRTAVVTLTRSSSCPDGADGHIPWAKVQQCLESHVTDLQCAPLLLQFARFLKNRGLNPMNLPTLSPDALRSIRSSVPIIDGLQKIIRGVEEATGLLGSKWKGRFDISQDGNQRSWVGSYSSGKSRWYGLYFLFPHERPEVVLWVDVTLAGDWRELTASLPDELRTGFELAREWLRGDDTKKFVNAKNEPLNEGKNTSFAFAKLLDAKSNADPQQIVEWFAATLQTARDMADRAER